MHIYVSACLDAHEEVQRPPSKKNKKNIAPFNEFSVSSYVAISAAWIENKL